MSRYRWPGFRRIVWDLFADFRELAAALKRREGQVAFLLLLVTLAAAVGLFFVVLGFDRLSDVSLARTTMRPFQCRTPDNFQSMFIVGGGMVFAMLAVLTLGEAMLFMDRKRRGLPARIGAVVVPTLIMLGVTLVGVVGMRFWC